MREILRYVDGPAVASGAADKLLAHLSSLLRSQSVVHLSITGGSLGILTLSKISQHPLRDSIDWQRIHIWWGDDRFVTEDSPDSNALQAYQALLFQLDLDPAKVHLFPVLNPKSLDSVTLQLESAVYAFNKIVAKFANPRTGFVDFDVTLLGMGPDGHVASLFPGHATPISGVSIIAEHNSPKPPAQRISFTYEAICNSIEVWFLVAGADKASAVDVAFSPEPQRLPVGRISGKQKTIWFLDEAASAGLRV